MRAAIAIRVFACLTFIVGISTTAVAHVTVWPRASNQGAHEKYTVRVPTEGTVATTSLELLLPAGIEFVSIGAPAGHTYELKKVEGKVVAIVWSMKINPGEFAEFSFIARNPKEDRELVWIATQRFADGTMAKWLGPTGDKHPASVTTLSNSSGGHDH
jgi:uncharacterized protein YcnI